MLKFVMFLLDDAVVIETAVFDFAGGGGGGGVEDRSVAGGVEDEDSCLSPVLSIFLTTCL